MEYISTITPRKTRGERGKERESQRCSVTLTVTSLLTFSIGSMRASLSCASRKSYDRASCNQRTSLLWWLRGTAALFRLSSAIWLKLLKELELDQPELRLRVRVIIHDMPNPAEMAPFSVHTFEYKFIWAWTTENGGLAQPFRIRQQRKV